MFKKILTIIIVLIGMNAIIGRCNEEVISTNLLVINEEPVKVGVLLSSYDDFYIDSVKKAMEDVQKENEGKVQYYFFDAKKNQAIQNEALNTLLQNNEVDLIILNLVNQGDTKYAIDRIKENNIPVILFGGANIQTIKSYNKAYWIGTDPVEDGNLQGQILVELWNKNKEKIDKNKDNIMQYVMLQGPSGNLYAIERAKHAILTASNAGIKTYELASIICNWSEEEAKNATRTLFSKFGNGIEVIIANNDAMAIGAIKALQEYGYNTGNGRMTIPVIGFDGTQEAQDLISKTFMAGTVIRDPYDYAKAFYTVGMNLVYNRNPLDGTEYKFDDTGVSIILGYKGIMINIR